MPFEIFKCYKCGYTLVIDCAGKTAIVTMVGLKATCPKHPESPLKHSGQRVARYELYEEQ